MAIPRTAPTLVLGMVAALLATAPAQAEVPYKTITSAGPLTSISIGNEGGCQIAYRGDSSLELYPPSTTPGDCGTLIATGTTLYAPNFSAHGSTAASALGSTTPFTAVSQGDVSGAGTAGSPLGVITVYDVGTTGLRVTEANSYVSGQEYYRTDVAIRNAGSAAQTGIIYRAGDCFLQENDRGYGFVEAANNGPGCSVNANNSPAGRIEQWVPLTAGSAYMEDGYSAVWSKIGTRTMLPSTCQCTTLLDNGAGLSWTFNVAPGATVTFSHLTVFSPSGVTGSQQQQPPQTPPPPTTNPGAIPHPPGSQALPLPSNRICRSRRAFPIHVRQYRNLFYTFAIVAVNGRRVPVYVYTSRRIKVTRIGARYLNRKRFRAFVDLRGLVKGRYRVRITAVTRDGQVLKASRVYRTCAKKRLSGRIPRL